MEIKKQFLGYNCQQVDGFLADAEKQEQDELNKISTKINACQQNNQKMIASLGNLLHQIEKYRELEQGIIEQILELVKILDNNRSQADQKLNAAQNELVDKLAELSNSYRIIEDLKNKLAVSHQQLEGLKQTSELINLY